MARTELLEGNLSRISDIQRLYDILYKALDRLGSHRLAECHGRMKWPTRGVYFFFEDGEERTTSGSGPRIVRVGTHAITAKSTTTLWDRLSQHRGVARSGSGNHRGSVFRLLVGEAIIRRDGVGCPTWGRGSSVGEATRLLGVARGDVQSAELPVEAAVTQTIGAMPFVWVAVSDQPSPTSLRGTIERNAIALLSNVDKEAVDAASRAWLGLDSARDRVRASGLWNNNHVEEEYNPSFLDALASAASKTMPP